MLRRRPRPSAGARTPWRSALRVIALAAVVATVPGVVALDAADAATRPAHPVGWLLPLRKSGAGYAVDGWAAPTDPAGTARVRIEIDGQRAGRLVANQPAAWVTRRRPNYGPDHGFRGTFPAAAGRHTICAFVVMDPKQKRKYPLNCRTITLAYNPYGRLDALTITPGTLGVSGWVVDPDAPTTSIPATLTVDGKQVATATASGTRSDVTPARAGQAHGFAFSVPISEGTHTVCVTGTNTGPGVTTQIGCATRTVSFSPTAVVDTLTQKPNGIAVGGWALDPDTSDPVTVSVTADGTALGDLVADKSGGAKPGHGFYSYFALPNTAQGAHTVCIVAHNLGTYGEDTAPICTTRSFDFNPTATVETVTQQPPGVQVTGWAADPDTSKPVQVRVFVDGTRVATVSANGTTGDHAGHMFTAAVSAPEGKHTICVRALNLQAGDGPSDLACSTITLAYEPFGAFESLTRSGTNILATGWAIDPDTAHPISVQTQLDGGAWSSPTTAAVQRNDVAAKYPASGADHGFAIALPADDGEHKVCVQADNVGSGSKATVPLGCLIIDAVHPVVPGAVTGVSATAGYGGARVVWTAPATDGGAPWTSYTVTASPGGATATVGPNVLATTVLGLKPSTTYTFSVVATNVAGASPAGTSQAVTTQKEPPAQTTPAPVSTSRYIRNITGSSAGDLATMRKEGAADAAANPSGHGYLILLDIGGQTESSHGVVLSAGIRFVSYTDLVKCVQAYVDGYASQQRPSAPVTIALGTNNDMDVSRSSGASWAHNVVNPVVNYARRYPGIVVAGADDIEPGFRAGYSASRAWLTGYLAATQAPFVFNGSADGCSPSTTNSGCNHGWTMQGLYWLAGGADPIRVLNLPQIYNTTMAEQWRYISLTGVQGGSPRINFGGALTEYTACQQAGGCGSLTGHTAWKTMWAQLNAQPELKPSTLPYSTDLRIDS